ncbi:MAG: hypothetical protein RL417_2428 [Pseudomonadota bacterium]|jgi:hypothetical protein
MSEQQVEVLAHRPFEIRIPCVSNSGRSQLISPEWLSIRTANIIDDHQRQRIAQGAPFLTGFIGCELFVAPGARGIITVVFSNLTVPDESLEFRTPGGLHGELIAMATQLLRGLQEREALVMSHQSVTRLALPRPVMAR